MIVKPLYLNNLGQHTETNELIWDDVLKVLYAKGQIRQDFVKSSLLKTDSNGFLVPAILGTDYVNYSYKNSITLDSNALQLVNDSSSPGNNKLYGTNSSGIRGWYNIPTSGITTEVDPVFTAHTVYNIIDGTGFLKNDGSGNWFYDNNTYLTSASLAQPDKQIVYGTGTNVSSSSTFTWDNAIKTMFIDNGHSQVGLIADSSSGGYGVENGVANTTSITLSGDNIPANQYWGSQNSFTFNPTTTSSHGYSSGALRNTINVNFGTIPLVSTGQELTVQYNSFSVYESDVHTIIGTKTEALVSGGGLVRNYYANLLDAGYYSSSNILVGWGYYEKLPSQFKNYFQNKTLIGNTYDFGDYKLQVHGDVSMGSTGGYMAYFKPSNHQIILEGSVSTKFSIDGLYSGYSYGSLGFASDFSTFMSNGGLQATNAGGWFKSVTPISVKKNMIVLNSSFGIGFYSGLSLDTGDDHYFSNGYVGGFDLLGNFKVGFGSTHTNLAKVDIAGSIRQTSVTSSLVKTDSDGILIAAIEGTDYVNYGYEHSITVVSNKLRLVNDSASPGNNKLYGTNASGVKGWYDQPSGSSGEVNTASSLGGGVSVYNTKVGVDLRFNSLNSSEFTLSSNVISINSTLKSNWNTAYSWGDHSIEGYLKLADLSGYATESWVISQGYITSETDPIFNAHTVSNIVNGTGFLKNNGSGVWSWDNNTYLTSAALTGYATEVWVNSRGFLTAESDPYFSNHTVANIIDGVGFLKNNAGIWSYDNSTYLTAADLTGYATQTWVNSQGFFKAVQQSVTHTSGTLHLVNDQTTPGNNKLYGTNASGVRGWYDIPSGGSGEVNTASNLGGGVGLYESKSGVDLQFNSLNSNHFSKTGNVVSLKSDISNYIWNTPWYAQQPSANFNIDGYGMATQFIGVGSAFDHTAMIGTNVVAGKSIYTSYFNYYDTLNNQFKHALYITRANPGGGGALIGALIKVDTDVNTRSGLEINYSDVYLGTNKAVDINITPIIDNIYGEGRGVNIVSDYTAMGTGFTARNIYSQAIHPNAPKQAYSFYGDGGILYNKGNLFLSSTTDVVPNLAYLLYVDGDSMFDGDIYQTSITSSLVKADSSGKLVAAVAGTDYTNYGYQHSITLSSNNLQLVNDSASPGNNKLYGTNNAGIKGWYNIPSSTDFIQNQNTVNQTANFRINGSGQLNNLQVNTEAIIGQDLYLNGITFLPYPDTGDILAIDTNNAVRKVDLVDRFDHVINISNTPSGALIILGYNDTDFDITLKTVIDYYTFSGVATTPNWLEYTIYANTTPIIAGATVLHTSSYTSTPGVVNTYNTNEQIAPGEYYFLHISNFSANVGSISLEYEKPKTFK